METASRTRIETEEPRSEEHPEAEAADPNIQQRWFFSNWWILTGSVMTGLVVLMSRLALGRYYSDIDARQLLEAMTESALFLNAAITTGSATIIALMLTLLGLTRHVHDHFQRAFHDRIRTIAWLATVALLGALIVLVTMTIPVVESEAISTSWYRGLWWTFSGAIAVVSGLFVSVVLTLLVTIIGAVDVLRPE